MSETRDTGSPPAPKTESSLVDWLTPGYNVLLVSAVMIPVTGAVVRWVAYSWRLPHPARLAVTATPAELAVFGVVPVIATAALFALSIVAARLFGPLHETWVRWTYVGVIGFLLALGAAYPVGLAYAGLAFIAYYLGSRALSGHPMSGSGVAAALVAAYVIAGIATGMRTTPSTAGEYTFAPRTFPAGEYLRVAGDDSTIYLAPCNERGTVIAARLSDVRTVSVTRPAEPQLNIDIQGSLDVLRRADLYEGCAGDSGR